MLVYSAKDEGSDLSRLIAEKLDVPSLQVDPRDLFKAIYTSILGQSSGPKAGWFLSSFEEDFLINRFRKASTYSPEKNT